MEGNFTFFFIWRQKIVKIIIFWHILCQFSMPILMNWRLFVGSDEFWGIDDKNRQNHHFLSHIMPILRNWQFFVGNANFEELMFFVGSDKFWQNLSLSEKDVPRPNWSDQQQVSYTRTKWKTRRSFYDLKLWNCPFKKMCNLWYKIG